MLPYNIYSHISLWTPAVDNAQEWMEQAQLVLVIGTSGYFGSAYWGYRRHDVRIIQINPKSTHFNSMAYLNIRSDADSVFERLMELEEEAQQS